jgi:hypothetical protein
MFDKYIFDRSPRFVETREYRAPTDESVRLLKEFEDAANDRINRAIALQFDNNLKVIAIEVLVKPPNFTHSLYVKFAINGDIQEETIEILDYKKDIKQWVEAIRDSLAQVIATKIVQAAAPKLVEIFSRDSSPGVYKGSGISVQ